MCSYSDRVPIKNGHIITFLAHYFLVKNIICVFLLVVKKYLINAKANGS